MEYSFVIITGMSGAGKTLAVKSLEDVGYFCIDNMPTALIQKLIEEKETILPKNPKIACVVDIRNGEDSEFLINLIKPLQEQRMAKIIFLDANENVLVNRYKETRRKHPLMFNLDLSLEQAVNREKEILSPWYERADLVLDTSLFSTSQLKDRVLSYILGDEKKVMSIDIISFGFKYGVPSDIDLLFDVRCLLNPYYVKELRNLTGNDKEVRDFVLSQKEALDLYNYQSGLVNFSLPLYIKEGKSHLTIAYGCTGGKHRSVTFANKLYDELKNKDYQVNFHHRDEFRSK